jgi:predicted acetyltransferase
MELIEPSSTFLESYKLALNEFDEHGISGFWKHFGPVDANRLQRIKCYQHLAGVDNCSVPATVFWLVDGIEFVGHVSVRHFLNAPLRQNGGHIGYAIRPSKQRQGYGSHILRLVIPHARALGIQKALITCDEDNVASRRIIEKNGGTISNEHEVNGKVVLRFWIPL